MTDLLFKLIQWGKSTATFPDPIYFSCSVLLFMVSATFPDDLQHFKKSAWRVSNPRSRTHNDDPLPPASGSRIKYNFIILLFIPALLQHTTELISQLRDESLPSSRSDEMTVVCCNNKFQQRRKMIFSTRLSILNLDKIRKSVVSRSARK